MKLDGRQIAGEIFAELKKRVGELKEKNITPHLAVILVGDNAGSHVYVMQKKLKGEAIDTQVDILHYPADISTEDLLAKIRELNKDTSTHGIMIQRPLPHHINPDVVQEAILDEKDVDGFKNSSPFHVPVVMAVVRVLEEVYKQEATNGSKGPNGSNDENASGPSVPSDPFGPFLFWLKTKNTVLLGKGSTAGQPIVDYFKEIGANFTLIDSKTENPQEIIKQADIIISSVGKPNLITPDLLKKDVILVGVGFTKDDNGKLHGDYEEERVQDIASFYTPTPGGVGPLNVAMILNNLVTAAEQK